MEKIAWLVAGVLFVCNAVAVVGAYRDRQKLNKLREIDSRRILTLAQELRDHPVRNGSREELQRAADGAAKPADNAVELVSATTGLAVEPAKPVNVYALRDAVIDAARGALAQFFAQMDGWRDPRSIRPPQLEVFDSEIMIGSLNGGAWTLIENQLFGIHKDKGAGRCIAENGSRDEKDGLFYQFEVGALHSIGFSVCVVGTNGVRRELSEEDAFNIGGKLYWQTGLVNSIPSPWSPIGDRMVALLPQPEGSLPELSLPLLQMPIVWPPCRRMEFDIRVLTGFTAKSIKPGEWLAIKVRRGCVVFRIA